MDSGNEESVSDERLEELEQAYEDNSRLRENVEAALEKALDDASTVKTASPTKQVGKHVSRIYSRIYGMN